MELVRQKNVATIITFPIVDADGDTVTGATALDSEIDAWTDGAAPDGFSDCTNEATEIGTTGIYYLSLTAAELNNDYIYIQVKTTSTGAKTQHILIRTIVGDPLNIATTDDGGAINVAAGVVEAQVKSMDAGVVTAAAVATGAIDADALAADAVAEIADGVWDEPKAGHVTATTFGDLATDLDTVAVDVAGLDGAAMRGTDNAALASVCTEARLSELDAGTPGKAAAEIDLIKTESASHPTLAEIEATTVLAKQAKLDTLHDTRVPDVISLANINAEVDTALDTAVPVAPTANSINERLKTMDDADLPGDTANIEADTQDIQSRLPAALVSGRMDASVGAMAAGVVTAAAVDTGAIDADALAADAGTEIAAAVWDRDATLSQTQGTFGQAIGDPVLDANTIYKGVVTDASGATVGVDVVAVQADTDNIQTRLPAALVSGRMDSDVGAMQNGIITAAKFGAGAIDAAALATDAANEIRDAVWAQAMTEATAVPSVTGTIKAAIEWLLALSRNKITQTATTQTLRNDADGATIGTSTHSDDGVTHTRGEWA